MFNQTWQNFQKLVLLLIVDCFNYKLLVGRVEEETPRLPCTLASLKHLFLVFKKVETLLQNVIGYLVEQPDLSKHFFLEGNNLCFDDNLFWVVVIIIWNLYFLLFFEEEATWNCTRIWRDSRSLWCQWITPWVDWGLYNAIGVFNLKPCALLVISRHTALVDNVDRLLRLTSILHWSGVNWTHSCGALVVDTHSAWVFITVNVLVYCNQNHKHKFHVQRRV